MECETQKQFLAATAPCCLMGDFYTRCKIIKVWLVGQGIKRDDATKCMFWLGFNICFRRYFCNEFNVS